MQVSLIGPLELNEFAAAQRTQVLSIPIFMIIVRWKLNFTAANWGKERVN